jgi:YidC/Oxa1 family membrane protein insertase
MDRNTVLGLVLIGALLIAFSYLSKPSKEQLEAKQRELAISEQQAATQIAESQNNIEKSNSTFATDSLVSDTAKANNLKAQYGVFATAAAGQKEFYIIENDLVKVVLSSQGGKPYSVELKKYKTFDKKPLFLFDGDSSSFGMTFYSNNRTISTNDLFFKALTKETSVLVSSNDTSKSLALRLYVDENKYIEYIYSLAPNQYMVNLKVNMVGVNQIITTNGSTLDLNWLIYARAQEQIKNNENTLTSIYYKLSDEVEKLSPSTKAETIEEKVSTGVKWIAYKQQFFSSVLISKDNYFENASFKQTTIADSTRHLKVFSSEIGVPYQNKENQAINLAFYFGPNHYKTLKAYNMDMEELVTLGTWIIKYINRFLIIPVFNFLNGYMFNYGIIILILTIFIKLLLFPLTYKSYLSMAKMRVLKPQIDEITERIPKDKPMERQQATMALYKKVGVSPLGGCLPMLLQMPILIAMFRFFPSSIELRQQGFLWAHDLSTFDSIVSWTTYIPIITPYFGNHISLFNLLMTVSTIFTIKINNQTSASTAQFPGMKTMMYIMPVMFMFVLNSFAAGLTYYYFLANMITIGQNEIFKRAINEDKILHQLNENKKKPVKKSKFQEKLEQAAKKRGYQMKK